MKKTSKFFGLATLFLVLISFSPGDKQAVKTNNVISIVSDDYCQNGYCVATTQKGYSCQNCAKSGSSYCRTHQNKNVNDNGYRYTSSCQAIASSTGVQCRNKAKNGSMYCGSHD
mgnify:CR=1 FL=1|tara:strand:- start:495 stop:836 length:342 start_codon:yes stop_codon:yes gene_type:complete